VSDQQRPQLSLEGLLASLRSRDRMRNMLRMTGGGLFWGCLVAVVVALFVTLLSADGAAGVRWWTLLAIPVGGLAGLIVGATWKIDDLRLARALDRCATSEDRFASALQLANHHRAERAQLVVADALERVAGASEVAALPLHAPRELRWLPAPAVVLALVLWLMPVAKPSANAQQAPEISPEEWKQIQADLAEELKEFPRQSPEDRELAERLAALAEKLKDQPDKKEALAEIARLREELEKRAEAQGSDAVSMRQAARSMQSSSALSAFAAQLEQGNYEGAAAALEELAEKLEQDKDALSAEEYEAIAKDLEQLAQEIAANTELSQACHSAAAAASKLNRNELAKACKNLSNSLKKSSSKLRKCDSNCRSRSMLDRLSKKLSKCKGGVCKKCGNGQCDGDCDGNASFVLKNQKKGGLKAGWGTAPKWGGGKLQNADEEREQAVDDAAESTGEMSVLPTISNDERAKSGQEYREMFASMVRKAEADLDLEQVPPAYRDYLRRYFVSIKPADREPAENDKKPAESPHE
jgi:hypothetical protein